MKSKSAFSWKTLIYLVVLTIPFVVMTFHQMEAGDYPDHLEFAVELAENGFVIALPHTLFAKSVVILRTLLPFTLIIRLGENVRTIVLSHSYEITALLVMAAAYFFTAFAVWKQAFQEFSERGFKRIHLWSMIATLVLMFVGPIFFFTYPGRQYLGYFSANPFHNPTFILLKPLALLWFYIAAENLFKKSGLKLILITALIVFLASSAKPSFSLTFLPAIALVWLCFYTKKFKQLNWPLLIWGMGVVAVLVLSTQYLVSYTAAGLDESVEKFVFAPFKTLMSYSSFGYEIPLKIVMSAVFPLYVTIYYWKEIKSKLTFQLGWMNFLVGLIMTLLFAEETRYAHGNFLWGSMTGIFILFVITVIHYFNDLAPKLEKRSTRWRDWVPALLLALHLVSGFIYYFNALISPSLVV